jgi:hypothetical protein
MNQKPLKEKAKRKVDPKFKNLNCEVYKRFRKLRKNNLSITRSTLKTIAISIAKNKSGCQNFKASNKWFARLKTQFKLKRKRLVGDASSANKQRAERFLKEAKTSLANFHPKDVFNCDEAALFFRKQRNYSFCTPKDYYAAKKGSARLTVLLSISSIGEKLPLLFVGKSKRPRCFKNISSSLKFVYKSNKTAWMTSVFFSSWLKELNEYFKDNERSIVMSMDNC